MDLFFNWAAQSDTKACEEIDCSIVQKFVNKKNLAMTPDWYLPGLELKYQNTPIQRVAEQMGRDLELCSSTWKYQ